MFDDLFSNFSTSAGEAFSNISSDLIQNGAGYVKSFLGFGEPPKQNLTAAQVQSGERGAPIQGNFLTNLGIPMPALLVGGAVVAALLLKK